MDRKERTLVVALGLSLVLVIIQVLLARASGSLALRAEAWHVVADLLVGIATFAGMRLARREKDVAKTGISVVENVVAILIALFILYVGFDIVRTVATEQPELRNLGWVIAGSLFTIGLAWVIARYEMYVGRQTESSSLIATAYHDMLDVYAHVVVLVGLVGAALGFTNLDRLAALLIVLFVAHSSYSILHMAVQGLRRRRMLLNGTTPGQPRRFRVMLLIAALIVVAFYALSGFYTVYLGERAVVRRFGRVAAEVGPGLHYHLPWPVDRLDRVDVSSLRRIETPGTLILTGDENLVLVRLGVHYAVQDAQAYLFSQRDPETVVASTSEAAIRRVVAESSVDSILTDERDVIEARAEALIQATLDGYHAGLKIVDVQVLESSPPAAVADAFRDVASAREDKNTYINEARAYENQEVALARGHAFETREKANAYRVEKVNGAVGDAIRFLFRRYAYVESPIITRQRLYLEAAERVLAGVQKYLVDPEIELTETDLWFTEQGTFPPPAENETP